MYEKFEAYLEQIQSADHWEETGRFEAEAILQQFTENDWMQLLVNLAEKPVEWKIKLAQCMGNLHNIYEIECLTTLLSDEDEALFTAALEALRMLNFEQLNFSDQNLIINRIRRIMAHSDATTRKILIDFLSQKL